MKIFASTLLMACISAEKNFWAFNWTKTVPAQGILTNAEYKIRLREYNMDDSWPSIYKLADMTGVKESLAKRYSGTRKRLLESIGEFNYDPELYHLNENLAKYIGSSKAQIANRPWKNLDAFAKAEEGRS